MNIRHVVTSFLRHTQQGTVLLGRRSKNVRTYPRHYAAISGSIENESPLERARIEIHEETGLADDQIQLNGEGQPLRFPDWGIGTLWVVHPFLFECKDPDAVQHDWEHTHFEWTPPKNIDGLQTVPRLREAWDSARRAAAAGGRPDTEHIFQRVADDRSHGAGELGIWTLEGIRAALMDIKNTSTASAKSTLARLCRRAARLRPSMATPLSAALTAWSALSQVDWSEAKAARQSGQIIDELIARREQAPLQAAEHAARLISDPSHVVTLSLSFSVLATLHAARSSIRLLSAGESRPVCEGTRTACRAAVFGIETELFTDAALTRRVRDADLAIIGADSIQHDGSVVNKVGSAALFSVARMHNVPTMVVADTGKIIPTGYQIEMEEMSPEDLGHSLPDVTVRNPYFETLPESLVDHIVAETGRLQPEDIRTFADDISAISDELF